VISEEPLSTETVAWLAGLLEGEGSFMTGPPSEPRSPVLVISMTDLDVIARVAAIFGVKVQRARQRDKRWKDAWAARVRGRGAVELMLVVRPHMGERRRAQIDRAVASYVPDPRRVLDDDGAASVLRALADGRPVAEVARAHDMSIWTVYDLRLGRSYRHLPRPRALMERPRDRRGRRPHADDAEAA
jgi:hypothetical protein